MVTLGNFRLQGLGLDNCNGNGTKMPLKTKDDIPLPFKRKSKVFIKGTGMKEPNITSKS